MSITLCLTHDCTLRCAYCYAGEKRKASMPLSTATRAIDFGLTHHDRLLEGNRFVLGFFGGEPLLEWRLLQKADAHAEKKCVAAGVPLARTVTTNLTLLTRGKILWLKKRNYKVGLSIDGTQPMHDAFRRYADGNSSFADCFAALKLAGEMGLGGDIVMVVNPSTVHLLSASVRSLAEETSFPISINPNYLAGWDDAACSALEKAYGETAEYYLSRYRAGNPVHITWLDGKIKTHLYGGYHACDRCALGKKELAVAPSGNLYPCPNLVAEDNRKDLLLGNVFTGFDETKRSTLARRCGNHNPACAKCPIASRCMNWCGCVNYFTSGGDVGKVGGFTCFHEKLSIRLADHVAETLWKERNASFLSEFYS